MVIMLRRHILFFRHESLSVSLLTKSSQTGVADYLRAGFFIPQHQNKELSQ